VFYLRRPGPDVIDEVLRMSQDLPLSYRPAGLVLGDRPVPGIVDCSTCIGHGAADFGRARAALERWTQSTLSWVTVFPAGAAPEPGAVVVVLIRHLGFWSLNGCRVLYRTGDVEPTTSAGFGYGTLTNHAEAGEERFEVRLDPASGDVRYRIRATSWGRAPLARVGQPIVRALQARFRRDSAAAMARAVAAHAPSVASIP
jgi:uncharacterized protein (UPF0548 family)